MQGKTTALREVPSLYYVGLEAGRFQHSYKPVLVRVVTGCYQTVRSISETQSFVIASQQPLGPGDHFRNCAEVRYGLPIGTEYLAVFVRILNQHASRHCGSFETPHGVPVAVCPTTKT